MNILVLSLLILLANIVLWVVLFARLKKQFSPDIVLRDIRAQVDALLREIQSEVSRDITIVNDRRQDLQAIIAEADNHILLSDAELKKREREKMVFETMQRMPTPVGRAPVEAIPAIVRNYEPVVPKKSIREQVLELAASGLTSEFIAQKLSISITEVQLYIDLSGGGV
jgi:DNA-binding NarL/FixJ family response regulator